MYDFVDGFHDVDPDFVEISELADPFMQLRIITVDAVVHDTIQIQIEII
jgi:hypothetical protein